ncbi:hypothetical protein COY90_00365 [Candidatus Roizmanbacteria bacterium CG_4_10_14_0_8_um_filter_39_9]|uniref:YtxH domain-containing protein n=1 Tax=Candidatus Roizmanbacteria bacterium CG_4_10_14_0_8_um_filter_39_9 TaxID=1974829 RepID=A0A2M7QE42_9BACT|nr:MAG: hypothetical protein COY90_00365 [Candidatus Roizmanbacteria bacterium CG_4_10_14_0_8_um_filter_39_9]
MKDQKVVQQDEGINPMVVAVAGAVMGAGIAVAGVALADKKNRDKIKETAVRAKELTVEYVEGIQKQVKEKKSAVEEQISEDKEKVRKVVASAKNSLHKTANAVNKAVQTI